MTRNSRKILRVVMIGVTFICGITQQVFSAQDELNPLTITEWNVPWEQSRPRDPYVDQANQVWFVGQQGDYIAKFDPQSEQFKQYPLNPGTGPHNLIVDEAGFVWYAGNRAGHIGRLEPVTGWITKFPMPNSNATDPHTLVFGSPGEIWFTVQQGNYVGQLTMKTGSVVLTPLFSQNARPYGIVMDNTNLPWFTQFGTNKLGTIDPDTRSVREITLPRAGARPRRLTMSADGNVWYVDYAEGYLGRFNRQAKTVKEWRAPGGEDARPYGMAVDDQDRMWFVETGGYPNRLVGFDTHSEKIISISGIESGGGTVRHMFYHQPTQTIWFGTDANTLGRAALPSP